MTIKEQLEALFDEKFDVENFGDYETFNNCLCEDPKEVKRFLFEQMIPKVLEEIVPDIYEECDGLNIISIEEIKQNAKEKFGIDL